MTSQAWSQEEIALLREFYPHFHTSKVSQAVGRSVSQCYQKAAKLGLAKTGRYLDSDAARRISTSRITPAMVATQFKAGQTPWNKGTRFSAGGRSVETRFKPGQTPPNWVPVGSTRINADGYLDKKVTDDGRGPRDWVGAHRLVWMEANGPVPDGHVVVFKPGRRTTVQENITLDAVELITRAELMARNTYHRYPKEVAQLVQLKGAITRQVNRIAKESR